MSSVEAMRASALATINDVPKAAKTGKTRVSRYQNGEQHLLFEDLKRRIELAIQ